MIVIRMYTNQYNMQNLISTFSKKQKVEPSMLPRYNFYPVTYGRHWDMLDALLLGYAHQNTPSHGIFTNYCLF